MMRLEIPGEVFTLVNINKRRTAPLHRLSRRSGFRFYSWLQLFTECFSRRGLFTNINVCPKMGDMLLVG